MPSERIGRLVRFHRKRSGLTQGRLAELAGVGKTVVFDVEKGKLSVRLDTLLKILNVLNVRLEFVGPLMALFKELDEKS